jgi:hypothetical protein
MAGSPSRRGELAQVDAGALALAVDQHAQRLGAQRRILARVEDVAELSGQQLVHGSVPQPAQTGGRSPLHRSPFFARPSRKSAPSSPSRRPIALYVACLASPVSSWSRSRSWNSARARPGSIFSARSSTVCPISEIFPERSMPSTAVSDSSPPVEIIIS